MSDKLLKRIEMYERLRARDTSANPSPDRSLKVAWGLALRLVQYYMMTGDENSLNRAAQITANICSTHFHFVWAHFLRIYIELELSRAAKAQTMLDALKPFRNNLKATPEYHAAYAFLTAAMELRRGKARAARKHVAALESYNNNADNPWIDALLGAFAVIAHEREAALDYLSYACQRIPQSIIVLMFAHEILVKNPRPGDDAGVLPETLYGWGLAVGADLRRILVVFEKSVKTSLATADADGIALCKALYARYKPDWLLGALCRRMINEKDYSHAAYVYYKQAEARQMTVDGLPTALVESAYANGIESVSRYTISQYFKEHTVQSGDSLSARLYVYYLLLTRDGAPEDIKRHKPDIVRLGLKAIETGCKEFFMPVICKVILEHENTEINTTEKNTTEKNVNNKHITEAMRIVRDALFAYEVRVDGQGAGNPARYVWVFEEEKARSRIYEITDGKAVVTASGPHFKYILFDDAMKNIPEGEARVTSRLPGAGEAFMFRLYEGGFEPLELMIALSSYCVGLKGLPAEGAELLRKTLERREISHMFRVKLSAALGNYHASRNDFQEAARRFDDADENLLDARGVENKLLTYVNAGRFAEAAAIISKKSQIVSDKALFYCIKKIAPERKHNKTVAAAAYSLSTRSWYDKQLVAIALEHAQASAKEWQEFSRALAAVNAHNDGLDESVLSNAIWMHRFDSGAQKVFAGLYERSPDNPYIMAFALYTAYESIVNGRKPEYETIETLEKLAAAKRRVAEGAADAADAADARFIYYGLSHVYSCHGINTFMSDEIFRRAMELCELDGFIFPIYKEHKDKSMLTPYIEKNQPFVYRGGKGKRVHLHYRPSGSTGDYVKKAMRYVRFGLYTAEIPVFYGEKLSYHFSEEISTGSVVTKESEVENNHIRLVENSSDLYYIINNAIIFESMFKYDAVEDIITNRLKERPRVKSWLF